MKQALPVPLCVAVLLVTGGCGESTDVAVAGPGPQGAIGRPGPGGPGMDGGASSPIRQIMVKLAKGPNSLTPVLGAELKEESPAWDAIQGQTKEYAKLASEMSQYDPPEGSKESWAKFTADYSGAAADLDKAAQAKDKPAALTAHGLLTNSCNACHKEHRQMGRGMGGPPGGPGMGGPPPGGGVGTNGPPGYPAPTKSGGEPPK